MISASRSFAFLVAAIGLASCALAASGIAQSARGAHEPERRGIRKPEAPERAPGRSGEHHDGGDGLASNIVGSWEGPLTVPSLHGKVTLQLTSGGTFVISIRGDKLEGSAEGNYGLQQDRLSFNNSIYFQGGEERVVGVVTNAPVSVSKDGKLLLPLKLSMPSDDRETTVVLTRMLTHNTDRRRPDFGLMLDDDGDQTFVSATAGESTAKMTEAVRNILATPIKTVSYCIGTGVLYYPTTVGSSLGWRETPFDGKPGWERIGFTRAGLERSEDPIRVGAALLRENGRFVLLSHRISDAHFIKTPDTYPLVPRFYLENRSLIIGHARSPVAEDADYGNLLNFTHDKVRKYNLDIMFEAADRYQDVIDGLEIDFVRDPFLFPRGAERPELITKLVADVRRHLDSLSAKHGRPYYLAVRVPPSLRTATWAGLDVRAWMERNLVDVVIPAQLMTLAGDQPVREFARLGEATGVKVHPALLSRANLGWPLSRGAERAGYSGAERATVTQEDARGAAASYYAMGADGIQLYNWAARSWVASPWFKDLTKAISSRTALAGQDMVFAVPPAYYFDIEDTYEQRKQLPVALNPGASAKLQLYVGTDLTHDPAHQVVLRLGFAQASEPGLALKLQIDGKSIDIPKAATELQATPASKTARSFDPPKHYAPPYSYLIVPIDPHLVKPGSNTIAITANKPIGLVELRLAVFRGG